MKLFSKKDKSQNEETNATPKEKKKGLLGFGKKGESDDAAPKKSKKSEQKGFDLTQLKLSPIVPVKVVSELKEYAERLDGGVRFINNEGHEGYTVLVITSDMLNGLTKNAHEAGQLALSIRNDSIRSATRKDDLKGGYMTVVPTMDTIQTLKEFECFDDASFIWGIFYANTDIEATQVTEFTSTIAELEKIAYNEMTIPLFGDATAIIEDDTSSQHAEHIEEMSGDNGMSTQQTDIGLDSEDAVDFTDEELAQMAGIEDDMGDDFIPDEFEESYMPDDMLEPEYDATGYVADESYMVEPQEEEAPQSEYAKLLEPKEVKVEAVDAVEQMEGYVRSLYEGTYALEYDNSQFVQLFKQHEPFAFSILQREHGALDEQLNELRGMFNDTLRQKRNRNLQTLEQMYNEQMATYAQKIQAQLDIDNPELAMGAEYAALKERYEANKERLPELIAEYKQELQNEYQDKRQAYVDSIAAQASREYDEKFGSAYERQVDKAKMDAAVSVDTAFGKDVALLTNKRQKLAQQTLQSVHVDILKNAQVMFKQMVEDEAVEYNTMKEKLLQVLETNTKSDKERTAVLRDALSQQTMADKVLQEQQDIANSLKVRIRELEEANLEAARRMQREHDEQVQRIKDENKAMIQMAESTNADLRTEVNRLREEIKETGERVKIEADAQMSTMRNTIESQSAMIKAAHEQETHNNKQALMRYGVIGLLFTVLGASGAFGIMAVSGDDEKDAADAAQVAQQAPTIITVPAPQSQMSDETPTTMEAYVASTQDGDVSVLVKYQDTYAVGETVPVLGSISGDKDVKSVEIQQVDGDTVYAKAGDLTFTFILVQ